MPFDGIRMTTNRKWPHPLTRVMFEISVADAYALLYAIERHPTHSHYSEKLDDLGVRLETVVGIRQDGVPNGGLTK